MRNESKATVWALAVSGCVLGATFGLTLVLQQVQAEDSSQVQKPSPVIAAAAPDRPSERGQALFGRNCAHCHGDDARGDEGPSLYNLALSDARIAKRIREGIKGEMPKFGSKLNDADIQALITYLRTLKD